MTWLPMCFQDLFDTIVTDTVLCIPHLLAIKRISKGGTGSPTAGQKCFCRICAEPTGVRCTTVTG